MAEEKTDPWGTPASIAWQFDVASSYLNEAWRRRRLDESYLQIVVMNLIQLTVSKALEKSFAIASVQRCWGFLKPVVDLGTSGNRTEVVDLFGLR